MSGLVALTIIFALNWIPVAAVAQAESSDTSTFTFEVSVEDPFRWMEDLDSPAVAEWIREQNLKTRTALDEDPLYEASKARIRALMDFRRVFPPIARGAELFVAEGDPAADGDASLSVIDTRTGKSRIVLPADPAAGEVPDLVRSATGSVFPSPDGNLVAYRSLRKETRQVTMRIVETETGRILTDRIEDVFVSLAVVAWLPDSSGFYYGRFSFEEREDAARRPTNHALYLHRVGQSQKDDQLVLATDDQTIRWFYPEMTGDGRRLVVTSALGTEANTRIWIADSSRPETLRELFPGIEASIAFVGSSGDHLWFQTDENSPEGAIVEVDLSEETERPRTVLTGSGDTLVYADLVAERLLVFRNHDAAPRVTIHLLDGKLERELPLPPLTTVWGPPTGGIGFVGKADDSHAYFIASGLFDPGTVYRLDPRSGRVTPFRRVSSAVDPSDYDGRQVFVESRDGTRIPMWLAWKKGHDRSRPSPTFMYAYGALGWTAFPWYQPLIVNWLDAGGVYAMPGIRGGGEYGEAWHQAGVRENRENVFEDYVSAAEWLIDQGYTSKERLVGNGGSISGALAGEALVRRPDLFGAMVVDIPVLDLLRFSEFNGAKMWVPEFGDSGNPRDLANLVRHSPYHMIRDDRCYPPTLVTAGEKDSRAAPHHAYKFVAALKEAQACVNPVRINVVEGAGHNFGTTNDQTSETWARQFVFAWSAVWGGE